MSDITTRLDGLLLMGLLAVFGGIGSPPTSGLSWPCNRTAPSITSSRGWPSTKRRSALGAASACTEVEDHAEADPGQIRSGHDRLDTEVPSNCM